MIYLNMIRLDVWSPKAVVKVDDTTGGIKAGRSDTRKTQAGPKRRKFCPCVGVYHHHHHQASQVEVSSGIGETSCLARLEFKFPANRVLCPLPAWLAWWWWWWWWW